MQAIKFKDLLTKGFRCLIKQVFIDSWWVIAFMILCLFLYEKSLENRAALHQQLSQHYLSLQKEKDGVLKQQKELERQIQSQTDLLWIELTLMKELGLVPEGQRKVYFYPTDADL